MKKQKVEPEFNGEYQESDDEEDIRKNCLVINVKETQYDVVKFVGRKIFKWKLSYDDSQNWDMYWTDCAVQPEQLGRMQAFQKINHFPGMYSLARKNHLGRNLMKMKKQFPNDYKFFPQTWLLPAEFGDFRNQFQKGKARTFIIKPEASCQGRGIFLTRSINDLNPGDHYVAQRYLHRPFLIDGLKFDLRVYVLLAGTDPLRIYVYRDGLVRFATEPYQTPNSSNLEDMCMHLTNYAINKDNPNFVFNQDATKMDVGHKRSIKSVFEQLSQQGHDIPKLWNEMAKLFIKTFAAVQPILSHHYRSCQPENYMNNMCFEILGFDIFINEKLQPILLEVNHTPSFTTDTPLDSLIKKNLIRDTLKLMNITKQSKEAVLMKSKESMQQRVLTGKKTRVSQEDKKEMMHQCSLIRDEFENKNLGDYYKIYPLEDATQYDAFIQYAAQIQDSWTGTTKRPSKPENTTTPVTNKSQVSKKPPTPQLPKLVGEDEIKSVKKLQVTIKPRQQSEPPKQRVIILPKPKTIIQKPCLQPRLFDLDILDKR